VSVTPAMRTEAWAVHRDMIRAIGIARIMGEDTTEITAERERLHAALTIDASPDGFSAAEIEAARALIIEVAS